MGVVSLTEAVQKLHSGGNRVPPGETRFVPLARVDVPADTSGDPRYLKLRAIAAHVSLEWKPADAVADILRSVTGARGAWASTDTQTLLRELIEAGLLIDRRNAQGDAEVCRNPDPPAPLSEGELLARETAAAAAREREMVQRELDTRERIGREHTEAILAAERQTIVDAMAPTIDRLESMIADLQENSTGSPAGETHARREPREGQDDGADGSRTVE